MITKFNQYKMNEEYGLSSKSRYEQQLMIKEIVKNINSTFRLMFSEFSIQITLDNNTNKSADGRYYQRLDLHKVSDSILELVEVEKQLIESGLIKNQFSEFSMQSGYFRLTFSTNPESLTKSLR